MTRPAAAVEVIRAGALTTVQDLGRPGWAHLGVPRSGALDPAALRLANRLVGNPEAAAGLEITLGGCLLRFTTATTVAVTGADTDLRAADRPADLGRPLSLPAGALLRIARPRVGLRNWLAVGGGLDVPPVLGSRSTDTLSGLGPAPLRDGDRLPLGAPTGDPAPVDVTPGTPPPAELRLRLTLGPGTTGSPPRRCTGCCTPRTRWVRSATGSARGWPARPCPARSPVNCPVRAWCSARCRSRRTASRWCSSPTTPPPAVTRSSGWSPT